MAADGHSYERKADRALARDQVDEPDDGRGAPAHAHLPKPGAARADSRGVATGALILRFERFRAPILVALG